MTNQTRAWVAAARPAADYRGQFAAFSVSSIELSRERSYDRTLLRFRGRGERTFPDAAFAATGACSTLRDART